MLMVSLYKTVFITKLFVKFSFITKTELEVYFFKQGHYLLRIGHINWYVKLYIFLKK